MSEPSCGIAFIAFIASFPGLHYRYFVTFACTYVTNSVVYAGECGKQVDDGWQWPERTGRLSHFMIFSIACVAESVYARGTSSIIYNRRPWFKLQRCQTLSCPCEWRSLNWCIFAVNSVCQLRSLLWSSLLLFARPFDVGVIVVVGNVSAWGFTAVHDPADGRYHAITDVRTAGNLPVAMCGDDGLC